MTHTAAEILTIAKQVFCDEIAGLVQVEQYLDSNFVAAVELLLACRGKIIVSGMGKSGHIGNKIAATLASTGSAAFLCILLKRYTVIWVCLIVMICC